MAANEKECYTYKSIAYILFMDFWDKKLVKISVHYVT